MLKNGGAAGCIAWMTVIAACAAPSTDYSRNSPYHVATQPGTTIDQAQEAVRVALRADGFRQIRHAEGNGESHLGRTTGSRSGAASSPFGISAYVDYFEQENDAIEISLVLEGFSMVSKAGDADGLLRKIEAQVHIIERASTSAPPPTPVEKVAGNLPEFSGERHALIVGISEYQDQEFDNLARAVKDAEALSNFLRSPEGGNIVASRIHLLLDANAKRADILDKLHELIRRLGAEDMLILYFACHGQAPSRDPKSGRFLVPFDGRYSSPHASAIEMDDLLALLDSDDAPKRQAVFLDCCFAGDVIRRSGDFIEADPFGVMANDEAFDRSIITSTKGSETALDSVKGSPNSPFATYLLRALGPERAVADTNSDGTLSAKELHGYLWHRVREAARPVDMHPQLYGIEHLPIFEFD